MMSQDEESDDRHYCVLFPLKTKMSTCLLCWMMGKGDQHSQRDESLLINSLSMFIMVRDLSSEHSLFMDCECSVFPSVVVSQGLHEWKTTGCHIAAESKRFGVGPGCGLDPPAPLLVQRGEWFRERRPAGRFDTASAHHRAGQTFCCGCGSSQRVELHTHLHFLCFHLSVC